MTVNRNSGNYSNTTPQSQDQVKKSLKKIFLIGYNGRISYQKKKTLIIIQSHGEWMYGIMQWNFIIS